MDKDVKIKEFETKLEAHLADIQRLYQKYNPDGKYLTLTYQDGRWLYNNAYWSEDSHFPIQGDFNNK